MHYNRLITLRFWQHLLVCALLCLPLHNAWSMPRNNPVPGGIALVEINSGKTQPQAFYKGKRIALVKHDNQTWALVGIPLNSKTGKTHIVLKWPDGQKQTREFSIQGKTYKAQYLTIKNKRKVNPNQQDMKRITRERKRKNKAKHTWTDKPVADNFIIPVHGRISSIFGLRRFFNKQPRNPHTGLDIAAPEGTPIMAVADGRVIDAGNFFFSGNMVYIDHGQGLISLYAHMHEIKVKPGDEVHSGDIIGTVGQTGRVTGPHLHLSVIANQTLVDPVYFLPPLGNGTTEKTE